jgi:UPF0755 protein
MRLRIFLIVALGLALFVAGMLHLAYRPIQVDKPVFITIERGESTTDIASRLDREGLLRSKQLFIWWAKLRKIDRQLQPGRYEVSGPTAMSDLLDMLHEGEAMKLTLTIPEGWTIARIASYLATELDCDSSEIASITHETQLLKEWEIPQDNMEGYLLPETYTFYWGVDPDEVIKRMLEESWSLFDGEIIARLSEFGWNRHEALTLASMIEAETGINNERKRISSVFHNRLRLGMLLQCDPTVVYGMGGLPPGRQLLRKDLEFESRYNTYLHPGLPPGPICNPGKAAILAALYPDATNELYFVADGKGGHIFTATLAEHNRAVARAKRERGNR